MKFTWTWKRSLSCHSLWQSHVQAED